MTEYTDFPPPKEMKEWLEREIREITKAAELRIKNATSFIDGYATGKLSGQEAAEELFRYSRRWGDALPGVARSDGLDDTEILARIDRHRTNKQTKTSGR